METFFTVSDQTWLFLWSCVIGAFLGVVYDFFRVLRIIKKHSLIAVFIEDFIYVTFCFFVIFIYCMEKARGEIRFFIFLGSLLGFAVYIFTAGNFIVNIIRKIVLFIKSLLIKIYNKLFKPVIMFFVHKFQKYILETVKYKLKEKKNLYQKKKHLKQTKNIVYNNHKHIQKDNNERDILNESKKTSFKKRKKVIRQQT